MLDSKKRTLGYKESIKELKDKGVQKNFLSTPSII